MKVVLDTNVLIAAFGTRGLCQAVFELCLENHQIIINFQILEELRENLKAKIKLPDFKIREIISYLKEHTHLVKTSREVKIDTCRDPSDISILNLAVNAQADYLITGDKDMLTLKEIELIPIVSPREFWERMRKIKK